MFVLSINSTCIEFDSVFLETSKWRESYHICIVRVKYKTMIKYVSMRFETCEVIQKTEFSLLSNSF